MPLQDSDLLPVMRPGSGTFKETVSNLKAATTNAVPAATESVLGRVELATAAETTTGTDNTRAVTPAGLKVELDKKVNKAGDTMTGNLTVPSMNDGQLAGFRNAFMNAGFEITEVSDTPPATTQGSTQIANRWVVYTTGTSGTHWSSSVNTVSDADATLIGDERAKFLTVNMVSGTSPGVAITHFIEDVYTLAGRVCTLSFWYKSDGNGCTLTLLQKFGVGGSPDTTVISEALPATLNAVKITRTFTMPSTIGKTVDISRPATSVFFQLSRSTGAAGNLTLIQPQIEPGASATPFEYRSPAVESAMCARYYQKLGYSSSTASSHADRNRVYSRNRMRIVPTATYDSLAGAGAPPSLTLTPSADSCIVQGTPTGASVYNARIILSAEFQP